MVPTEMLTSMLLEPSSGSNSRRYLPFGYCAGMGRISSISSEAMAARWPDQLVDSIITSLDITSSFFCSSPCTFSVPAPPSTPASAPLFTAFAITLVAVTMSLSNSVNSPVAPGMRRCSSMMNWVMVVPVVMMELPSFVCFVKSVISGAGGIFCRRGGIRRRACSLVAIISRFGPAKYKLRACGHLPRPREALPWRRAREPMATFAYPRIISNWSCIERTVAAPGRRRDLDCLRPVRRVHPRLGASARALAGGLARGDRRRDVAHLRELLAASRAFLRLLSIGNVGPLRPLRQAHAAAQSAQQPLTHAERRAQFPRAHVALFRRARATLAAGVAVVSRTGFAYPWCGRIARAVRDRIATGHDRPAAVAAAAVGVVSFQHAHADMAHASRSRPRGAHCSRTAARPAANPRGLFSRLGLDARQLDREARGLRLGAAAIHRYRLVGGMDGGARGRPHARIAPPRRRGRGHVRGRRGRGPAAVRRRRGGRARRRREPASLLIGHHPRRRRGRILHAGPRTWMRRCCSGSIKAGPIRASMSSSPGSPRAPPSPCRWR